MDNLPQVLTTGEASRYLRIPLSSFTNLPRKGKFPVRKSEDTGGSEKKRLINGWTNIQIVQQILKTNE